MKVFYHLRLAVVIALIPSSCCKGGSGGQATLVASPYHHTKPIQGAILYVKYNTTDPPGTNPSDYDAKFTAGPNEFTITCNGLKCGDYYLYCTGYDSTLLRVVTGGMTVHIKYSDRKSTENINVAITE